MNKLLRNPWVVATLVLGMAALWWVQMRDILYPGGVTSVDPVAVANEATAPLASEAADSSEPAAAQTVAPSRVLAPTQLRWDSAPTRDPFGPVAVAAPAPDPSPVESAPVETVLVEPVATPPALEAVLNTPSAHIAVIDGRIVRVGDKVGGRAVLRIDSASVALGAGPQATAPLILKLPTR